jgi:hypothetical protein
MVSDYRAIRTDNERRYGTDIGRIGPMLLAERYDDRTHFIFELLQNAEDALVRRSGSGGLRSVNFHLSESMLRVSHFGQPFDEADVRGICGIAESTKDLTAIGRFGIGFKSVYAFTDCPEIHSGSEDFAIENFVWPVASTALERDPHETVVLIPLKASAETDHREIAAGLERLGALSLLFLRKIDEIKWSVEGGRSGLYLRESKEIDAGVRCVTVIGQDRCGTEVDEAWLVFSHPVTADDGRHAGHVEIAFSVVQEETGCERIQVVERSPLVVFFPTVLETHLGFLVQGPYRTTPSRDNVPRSDPWNRRLVGETASLLVKALRWLRDHDLLDTATLRCLPLDPAKFDETSMFAPLFEATRKALSLEPLLPRFDAGYVPAAHARLARTQELRELFVPLQLAGLYGEKHELPWLSGEITQDRTPELRWYLMYELSIAEVTPDTIISRLDKEFLQSQPDDWIVHLYHFLNGQPALRGRLSKLPLVRLEDGSHVPPEVNGQPQAFLPGPIKTGFPTARASVCATDGAREFLRSLGLTEPDPVDDVVRNVLPKYKVVVSDADYETDIRRILTAFSTDSKGQREKLIAALRKATFMRSVDTGDGSKRISQPGQLCLATERLKELFRGVRHVLLVDDTYACLRGEDVRELLESCGAVRYLRPVVQSALPSDKLRELRAQAGHPKTSGQNDRIVDWTLKGLRELLESLPSLDVEQCSARTRLLWEELAHLEERRGMGIFTGEYTWTHYGRYTATFDAAFVRQLNAAAWVPGLNGELERSEFIVFDTLGWKPNPFLQSKIRFKPPLLYELAEAAGIEPGALDLLKKLGVTSEAELRNRLGLTEEPTEAGAGAPGTVRDALKGLLGDVPDPAPPVPDPASRASTESRGLTADSPGGGEARTSVGSGQGTGASRDAKNAGRAEGSGFTTERRTPRGTGCRPFISYVSVHPDEDEPDPDGLDQSARMALEANAIDVILSREPHWQRTPAHNPGYDLFEADEHGNATRLCEVKAMTGCLHDRPVGLSHTQFRCAQEYGEAYWLYVMEHAGDGNARIVRIRDPVGKARTFTFDRGWLDVADVDRGHEDREE